MAANTKTSKPFNTAMGRQEPVRKWCRVEKPYENWQRTTLGRDAFCCFPTPLLKNCFSRYPSPRNFVATVSKGRYHFDFRLFVFVGASPHWFVLGLAIAIINPFYYHWAVENAHKNIYFCVNPGKISYLYLMPMGYKLQGFIWLHSNNIVTG